MLYYIIYNCLAVRHFFDVANFGKKIETGKSCNLLQFFIRLAKRFILGVYERLK